MIKLSLRIMIVAVLTALVGFSGLLPSAEPYFQVLFVVALVMFMLSLIIAPFIRN